MPNVYIETYGCSANQAESEIMAGLLSRANFNIVENIEIADVVLINSCFVKTQTEQKIIFRIKEIQKKYPEKKLIIGGCLPEGNYEKIVDVAPKASLISTHHITKIVNVVKETLEGKRVEYLGKSREIKLCLPRIRKNPIVDIVEIADGCEGNCSYCCVRFAKGIIFSFPLEKVVKEINLAIKEGCKEIWITSQDNAAYGAEEGKRLLPELLKKICEIPGNFYVRVGMMNPKNVLKILPDLIKAYKNKKIYKFLHLPLQSGDNEILKKMKRGYTREDFEKIVKNFEDNFRFQLWTDVIVGYPGETEKQFEKTIEVIKKVKPDWVNVSKFGKRPKTEAEKLKQLDSKIVKERSKRISAIVEKIAFEKNKEWIGWEGKALISEKGRKGKWIGRNFAYKPIVIEKGSLGKLVKVRIIDATPSYLIGKVLS